VNCTPAQTVESLHTWMYIRQDRPVHDNCAQPV